MLDLSKRTKLNQLSMSKTLHRHMSSSLRYASSKCQRDFVNLMVVGRPASSVGLKRKCFGKQINVANCLRLSDRDAFDNSRKERRYSKRAMVTKNKSDEELLELITARLADGFNGLKKMFKYKDPDGGESISPIALHQVLTGALGYIPDDAFIRMLQNLGLDSKEKISFDTFVSRFKEFEDIQKQWTAPIEREEKERNISRAHPEEHLRDCIVPNEWAQLNVSPHAIHLLKKHLTSQRVDLRSLLPDDCFVDNGVVSKSQMRAALLELGIKLTDIEFTKFWETLDSSNVGRIPQAELYRMLGLNSKCEPVGKDQRKPTVVLPKSRPLISGRSLVPSPHLSSRSAREFALGRHVVRSGVSPQLDVRGCGIVSQTSITPAHDDGDGVEEEEKSSPMADAEARSKIRTMRCQETSSSSIIRFDSIIDCLHYQFEQRCSNLVAAFKLFDINDDGYVMRIDFRRVLAEFGFNINALSLPAFLRKLGLSVTSGLINYRQMMSKLLNRTDNLVSNVLDNKVNEMLNHRDFPAFNKDEGIELSLLCRLIQYIHHDYMKMVVSLLRCDCENCGLVPMEDMRQIVEHALHSPLSSKQWNQLQRELTYDSAGNARYVKLMLGFGGDLAAWNRLQVGQVSVPKNKIIPKDSVEVKTLRREMTDTHLVSAKQSGTGLPRNAQQIRKDLSEFFATNLHEVDKRYKELDRKCHKRFSMWQFGAILKLSGFPISDKELEIIWTTIKVSEDNMSTFGNVLKEFSPTFAAFQDNNLNDFNKTEETNTVPKSGCVKSPIAASPKVFPGDVKTPLPPIDLTRGGGLADIMVKVRPVVKAHWETVYHNFCNRDPHGFGSVSFNQMQRLLDEIECGLTPAERDQLCAQFDFKTTGRCNYLAFMKAFSEPTERRTLVYNPNTHLLEKTLLKHWKNLRRAFKTNDRSRTGYLNELDFKQVLKECEVPVCEEDFYHIQSQFDWNMDGQISYQEFIDTLLRLDPQSR